MSLSRRALMHASVLGAGVWPVSGLLARAKAETSLAYDGVGIYLYPAWGVPRPYLVRPAAASGQGLEFCDPATSAVLWTQSLSFCGDFAGKLS